MNLDKRVAAFSKLGDFLAQFNDEIAVRNDDVPFNDIFFDGFMNQLKLAHEHNGWFTKSNLKFSIKSWSKLLNINTINEWIDKYNFNIVNSKKVAIIMAGNIPLVGFHDFLAVLISGHNVLVKQSSNDKHLMPLLAKYLEHVEPEFKGKIEFTEEKLVDFDAVIATGSNNTSRYFEYYFKEKQSIIRKNRNSTAILTGDETEELLNSLAEDIFRYFGLGCRSVSKLFVPEDYNFDPFFNAIYSWKDIINDKKYANNYDYNKAVYLMSEFDLLDNGFLMLKEDTSYASPIATVFYETYDDIKALRNKLNQDNELIQCIVSNNVVSNSIEFGSTQQPQLWQYADGVDTVDFLLKI